MEQTMDKRKKLIVSIIAIFMLILTLLGITYAYFVTRIKGNTEEESVKIKTSKLELIYGDGNGILEPSSLIIPGSIIDSKTFSVESKSNETIDTYGVYLEELINEFERTTDITMDLTCNIIDVNSGVLIDTCEGFTNIPFPKVNSLIVENKIDVGTRHEYTITLNYPENYQDQSNDMNKKIRAKIQIYDTKDSLNLTGNVNGASLGDYIELTNSEGTKTSYLVNNQYTFVGVLPGKYTISVKNNTEGNITTKGTKNIEIERASTESIENNKINVTESTKNIGLDIESIQENLNVNISLN